MVDEKQKINDQTAKPFTAAQKQAIKQLFAKYNPKKLTGAEAKSIFKAMEAAGIHGHGSDAVIEAAGMDPQKFWALVHQVEAVEAIETIAAGEASFPLPPPPPPPVASSDKGKSAAPPSEVASSL